MSKRNERPRSTSAKAGLLVLCTICLSVIGLGYLSAALVPASSPSKKDQAPATIVAEQSAVSSEPVLLAQASKPTASIQRNQSGVIEVESEGATADAREVAETQLEVTNLEPRTLPKSAEPTSPEVLSVVEVGGSACVSHVRSTEELLATNNTPDPRINGVLAAPVNDDCVNAVTLTQGTSCVNTAGTNVEATQSVAAITCAGFTSTSALDSWFKFVATTTNPTITVTGGGTLDVIVDLRSGACNGTNVACADATTSGAETINATGLTIGNTYLFRVYGWAGATGTFNACVFGTPAPTNDTCSAPSPLTLNVPSNGTNVGATNDYTLTGTLATCYTSDGEFTQTASNPVGRDTVWSFTAPSAGLYSFRAALTVAGGNLDVYTNTACPVPGAITCGAGTKAANRHATTAAFATEEVMCKSMAAGETRYVFVDEVSATTTGGGYTIEVNPCTLDPDLGNTPATASSLVCGIEGSIASGTAPRDQDFFSIGSPAAGSRVFAIADSVAATSNDIDLRVTDTTTTLEYDDGDNNTPWGSLGPNIQGRATTGVPTYLEVTHFTSGTASQPYRLYAVVQPPGAGLGGSSATAEVEPNGTTLASANSAANNFFSGVISPGGSTGDLDLFAFGVNAGDLITIGIDGDPLRNLTPVDFAIFLFDNVGTQILGFTDVNVTSNNTASVGLLGATPASPGEAITYRARYSGVYYAGVNTQSAAQTGDYLLSIGINCNDGTALASDLSVTKSAPATAPAGSNVPYTITVNNAGPNAANGVSFTDTFPAGTSFVSLTGPAGWSCTLGAGSVTCTNQGLGAGIPQVFTLTLSVPQCYGNIDANNSVTVTSVTADGNLLDNSSAVLTSIIDPGTCSDGNACTTGDTCVGTVCTGGPPPSCDDADVCTTDSCNAGTGLCEYAPVICNDSNACTDDVCEGPTTGCVYTNDDTNTCSDGNACTQTDSCLAGSCVGSNPVVCDDANPCTTDACNTGNGLCVYTGNSNPCSDGSACTTGDTCGPQFVPSASESFDEVVAPALPVGWSSSVLTGTGTNYVTVSTSSDTAPNSAFGTDGTVVSDQVLVSAPIPITSAVSKLTYRQRWSFEFTGTTCYDASVLDIKIGAGAFTDIVTAGGSFASNGYNGTVSNGFSNPLGNRPAWCFQSTGYPAYLTTVVNLPAAAAGQTIQLRWHLGTDSSTGAAGQNIDSIQIDEQFYSCIPGAAVVCDDSNVCTTDSCLPASGCDYANNAEPCDDGSACTDGDTCGGGVCQPGGPTNCDDNNPCTDDSCDPQSGCVHVDNSEPCDDGSACTDGDVCGGGVCTPGGPVNCDDNNPCTDDSCDPETGCIHTNNTEACDDGDACTSPDVCSGGTCVPGGPIVCNDNNPCTDDSCSPGSGCVYTNNTAACDDSNACTSPDVCAGGVCTPGGAVNCDDGNVCTDDSCDPQAGCLHVPNTAACDDSDACTAGDACVDGACVPGGAITCNDNNPCTDDSCLPASGCHYENNTAPCDDGDACTVGDVCGGGSCQPGGAANCDDSNPCTDDSCLPASGCHYENNTDPCSDGNACTTGDVCGGGACQPGGPTNCDDSDACTTDSCLPASGCQHGPVNCDDGNVCTSDSCNPATGCEYLPVVCNDNDACTSDACVPGVGCVFAPITCNDGNVCTDDSCNPATGCVYTNNTASCDDGNACTVDVCSNGSCGCPPPQACVDSPFHYDSTDVPKTISTTGTPTVTSTLTVSGAGTYLQDVDVKTFITHTSDGQLQVTITSPAGTIVTLTSNNGGTLDNAFNGTVWNDSADPANQVPFADTFAASFLATDTIYTNLVVKTTLVPEDRLGAFIGENPNGVWTLTVADQTSGDGGSLANWSLDLRTLATTPGKVVTTVASTDVPKVIPATAPPILVSSTTTVAVAGTKIGNVRLTTFITHSFPGDIDMTLRSPAGTIVTITSDNAASNDNVFNGTVWDDKADPLNQVPYVVPFASSKMVTDTAYVINTIKLTLSPEEALAAFKGENPNGVWTLTLTDDANVDGGNLANWSLEITTEDCTLPCSVNCDDNNPCTDDACDTQTGCYHTNNTASCNDGNACTTADTCGGGSCAGSPVNCDDGNTCTDDSCTPGTGLCAHASNTNSCNDGNACTSGDVCTPPVSCGTSGNQNFDGVTAPALPAGWTSTQTGTGSLWVTTAASSDTPSNSAFGADGATVSDELLVSAPFAISSATAQVSFRTRWTFENSGASCFDGGVLEIKIGAGSFTDIVTAGGSFVSGGYTGTVSTGFSNPLLGRPAWCAVSTGYPAYTTSLVNLPAAAAGQTIQLRWRIGTDTSTGAAGQNVDTFTVIDTCPNTCQGSTITCDDSNPCTDDSCDSGSGCVYTPNTASCDDGNPCTENDTCGGGSCQPGTPAPAPGEVTGVVIGPGTAISWTAVPSATLYDVAYGTVLDLQINGTINATCLANDVAVTNYTDVQPNPAVDDGYFYLIRAQSACGYGGYGFDSAGSPRTPTSACP